MGKLTAKRVLNASPRDKEYLVHDGEGLFLRVRPSGAKSWLFSFSLPGSSRACRMTLTADSLKEAREMLSGFHKLVAQGIDPRHARAAIRAENSRAVTMQALFEAWIEFLQLTGRVTASWVKAHIGRWNGHLKAPLGNILARDITRAHLAAALDGMSRKGIREETRKALTTLNLMLDYGLTRHMVDQNHARVLKPKDFSVSAGRPRDRVLSLAELRRLWVALDGAVKERDGIAKTSVMNIVTATAIKLLILTGARRGEVAEMRWDEVDLVAGVWSIPSHKTKNRQAHTIYLAPISKQLIETLQPITGQSSFVFNAGLNSRGRIHTDTLTRSLRRLMKKDKKKFSKAGSSRKKKKEAEDKLPLEDMKPFTLHDLRRAGASAWGEHLKIKPHVIEHMLNHQPLNKLIATYQRATYAEEQKSAWLKWGEMVESQIANNSNNIIPINKLVADSNSKCNTMTK